MLLHSHLSLLLLDSMIHAAEIATGKGILGQVALEAGVPQSWVEIGLLVLLGYNVVAVSLSACWSLEGLLHAPLYDPGCPRDVSSCLASLSRRHFASCLTCTQAAEAFCCAAHTLDQLQAVLTSLHLNMAACLTCLLAACRVSPLAAPHSVSPTRLMCARGQLAVSRNLARLTLHRSQSRRWASRMSLVSPLG